MLYLSINKIKGEMQMSSSKIVIKDVTLTKGPSENKVFKVVKLVNHPRIELMGSIMNADELKKFVQGLPARITYEVVGGE